jgi:hypothetical protein
MAGFEELPLARDFHLFIFNTSMGLFSVRSVVDQKVLESLLTFKKW